jgi:hypothetical protein
VSKLTLDNWSEKIFQEWTPGVHVSVLQGAKEERRSGIAGGQKFYRGDQWPRAEQELRSPHHQL